MYITKKRFTVQGAISTGLGFLGILIMPALELRVLYVLLFFIGISMLVMVMRYHLNKLNGGDNE